MRVGIGYDVHRLVEDRKLILGGVEIPFDFGLSGHSDADVLVHAIMDAILGACALGDIGLHFPDTDDRYKGVSSIELLKEVNGLIKVKGYRVNNIDAVVVAQKPKILPYIYEMRKNIAEALCINAGCVSVKGTTTEGLGFEGTMEGISAQSVVSLEKQ